MANFRLDRFKFKWRGQWLRNVDYKKDDIIYYEGKTYVCLQGHTSQNYFYDDLGVDSKSFIITVGEDSLNGDPDGVFYIDGEERPVLRLRKGNTYTFIQNDETNVSYNNKANPFLLSVARDGIWNGGGIYAPNTTYFLNEQPKTQEEFLADFEISASRKVTITIPSNAPDSMYYFSNTNENMGEKFSIKYDSEWELMTDGYQWTGDWQPNTPYAFGQIAKYKGNTYICINDHRSTPVINLGIPQDITNWTLHTSSPNWLNEWTVATYYDLGDVVRYGGNAYICIQKHTSATTFASGLELDNTKWTLVTKAFNWIGDWQTSTTYKIDDVVKYGATIYRAVSRHTSSSSTIDGLEIDNSHWQIESQGIEYVGDFAIGTRYRVNDVVKSGGVLWKCKTYHTSTATIQEQISYWDEYAPGYEFDNVWDSQTVYQKGDIVRHGGYVYAALNGNVGINPADSGLVQDGSDWEVVTRGYNHRGEWNVFDEFYTGDIVRNNGYVYVALEDSTGVYPDSDTSVWKILAEGHSYRAEWVDNTEYFLKDIVVWQGTSYICIARHDSSTAGTRPDLDVAGSSNNWVIYVQGDVDVIMTDRGDTIIENSGKTALPIGTAGQVLKVTNGVPSWEDQDTMVKVFYVTTDGEDGPGRGTSLSNPFRTVKYACDHIQANINTDSENTTIFVKTGYFAEVLPIKVPRNCAIVGDELRSTIIAPAAGYEQSDMFWVNNGSGIRNMTLQGLYGTLGEPNENLTRRPTAGAFVSLDPGTGPDDQSVWILNKSPYVQNVSTFGTACVGMKIDGALHNGGNRSTVANDFTQILSDGIGYWATNIGRSELVSVFTYYNHIGYLAENGGILRATNGNNSYGTFGSVAEGFNENETPITGKINNQSKEAQYSQAFTYGTTQQKILAIGYSNCGRAYTNANITFGGAGSFGTAVYDEFRNGAVDKIRVAARGDSSIPGGDGYTFIANNAQTGDTGRITIAQADVGSPEEYIGQRLIIVSGKGVGQYGIISGFDPVSKITTISKESNGQLGFEHFMPGWPIETVLDETTRYVIEPRPIFPQVNDTLTYTPWYTNNTLPQIYNSNNISYGEDSTTGRKFVTNILSDGSGNAYLKALDVTSGIESATSTEIDLGPSFNITDMDYVKVSGYNGFLITTGTNNLVFYDTSNQSNPGELTFVGLTTQTVGTVDSGNWKFVVADYDNGYHLLIAEDGTAITTNSLPGIGQVIPGLADYSQVSNFDIAGAITVAGALYGNNTFIVISTDGKVFVKEKQPAGTPGALYKNEIYTANLGFSDITITDSVYGNNAYVVMFTDNATGNYYSAVSFDGIEWTTYLQETALKYVTYGAGTFLAFGDSDETTEYGKTSEPSYFNLWNEDSTGYQAEVYENGTPGLSTATQRKAVFIPGIQQFIMTSVAGATSIDAVYITAKTKPVARVSVSNNRISSVSIYDPGANLTQDDVNMTVYDNGNTINALFDISTQNGVLPQPRYTNRGQGYTTLSAQITGDGYADIYQLGNSLILKEVTDIPGPGANLVIDGIEEVRYSVSRVDSISGTGPFDLVVSITPKINVEESPDHETTFIMREQYSQIRLTGHDFLDIGSGNQSSTRYPDLYLFGEDSQNERQPFNETVAFGGGRVFYTSTDQDGNFRVGELFQVEQSTGIVTVNASFFDLTGLSEISLGGIQVGGSAVVIREFSKDPTFAANSNNVVPTQKAIASYVSSRISGGGANAQTNKLVSGQIAIDVNRINTTSGLQINMPVRTEFVAGFDGHWLATQYFGR